jgi:hypothetical protein
MILEINNDNNKNDIVWLILSLFFFSQSAAMAPLKINVFESYDFLM